MQILVVVSAYVFLVEVLLSVNLIVHQKLFPPSTHRFFTCEVKELIIPFQLRVFKDILSTVLKLVKDVLV
jgi:hypothetical protein